jgi:hypothetical protein
MLLKAALMLCEQDLKHWIVIFTDKEELKKGEKIEDQGSFGLTKRLRALGLSNAQIFNFDACGCGDTFVFSSTVDYLLNKYDSPKHERTGKMIKGLRQKALTSAKELHLSKVLLAPIPFSDDAGFLHGGIPAQTITMLPANEANPLAALLRIHPDFADQIILNPIKDSSSSQVIPQTWRYLNSPSDIYSHLTPEHYEKIVRFAVQLCR